ncbi:MAG: carboxypeptidase-like regulatory domain-containing protein, partial [Bacteroidota bacterium]
MKKNILLNLLICTIILFSSSQALSQSTSFHGKVIDKNNGEPINNVNVYVANTSIGTTTDSQGYFELTNLPQGTFDIIFSHVSYYFNKKRLLIKQRYNDIGIIELSYKVHQLETVIVEADETSLWNDRYEVFVEKFIGTSDNADSTFIIDPYKIDFWESDG